MKIARRLKTDKRTKSVIKADVHATKIILQYDNITLNLSTVIARRIATTLDRAVSIQETRRKDSVPSSPSFSKQILVEPQPKQLTTLERRLELCRYIYQIIKEKHPDIPKYRKSKINAFIPHKTCYRDALGRALAHAHNQSRGKYKHRICIQRKYLLNPLGRTNSNHGLRDTDYKDLYQNLGDLMAHEIAHLKISSCRHCKKWFEKYKVLQKTITTSIQSGEFIENLPLELKE